VFAVAETLSEFGEGLAERLLCRRYLDDKVAIGLALIRGIQRGLPK
jgi:hypothetical protein